MVTRETELILKEIEVEVNSYTCDLCGSKYTLSHDATKCELECRRKTCKHVTGERFSLTESFESDYSDRGEQILILEKYCLSCGKLLESIEVPGYTNIQEAYSKPFSLLEESRY